MDILLVRRETKKPLPARDDDLKLMSPGDVITTDMGFMRGHGTYLENEKLTSNLSGLVDKVNKLISVHPVKSRYTGEIGDVVIGRVMEVGQKKWKISTNHRLDSILMLSAVNLPGGELRRRSEEDERMMRSYLAEDDLVSAEVQSVYQDGSLALHTRNLRYGKLGQGVLIKVLPALIKRRKSHFHNLTCGASIILANNGYVWISPVNDEGTENTGGFVQNLELISSPDREVICRLRNCILALAAHQVLLYDTSIMYAYEESIGMNVKELINKKTMQDIAEFTRNQLELL